MKTAILLLGHGSNLGDANESLHEVARLIKTEKDCYIVRAAFLSLARPSIGEGIELCVKDGAKRIVVIPYFLYMGAHVKRDIPNEIEEARLKHPDVNIILGNHLDVHRKLIEIVIERVEEKIEPGMPIDDPGGIEKKSFEIIDGYISRYNLPEKERIVIRRVIHSTAEFEFARDLVFHEDAVRDGIEAMRRGSPLVVDVGMVRAGINKDHANRLGIEIVCHIGDEDLKSESAKTHLSRAMLAMKKARNKIEGGIVAIGNAPTALREVIRLVKEDGVRPSLVIGIPVGLVGAVESKDALRLLDGVPFITNKGRRGGSSVATAIVNEMMNLALDISR